MKSVFSRLAAAVVAGVVCAGSALAQQATVIRLSHGMPEALDSGQHAWSLVFKEAVESGSGGRIEVRILGNNAAGNERQQLERVQNGINQMLLVSEITQPFFFKPALVMGMPFLFSSSQVAWDWTGPLVSVTTPNFRRPLASVFWGISRVASGASSTARSRSRRQMTLKG